MFKRAFFAMLGLGAGVLIGTWAVRKVDRTQAKLTPGALGSSAAGTAQSVGSRVSAALVEGRRAAGQREAELRAVYRGGRPGPAPGAGPPASDA